MANQYKNKVQRYVNGSLQTVMDISGDTVSADKLLQGYTAHDKSGAQITGTVSFVTYYTSTSAPTSSQGSNGDIWLKTVS